MPYIIGNGWGGGLVPFITTAAYQPTGSPAYGLILPDRRSSAVSALELILYAGDSQNEPLET